jgi:hypothetical protein
MSLYIDSYVSNPQEKKRKVNDPISFLHIARSSIPQKHRTENSLRVLAVEMTQRYLRFMDLMLLPHSFPYGTSPSGASGIQTTR